MRMADSHSRRAKFAEIVAVVENVYCILSLDVASARDGSTAHAQRILRGYRGDGAGAEDGERCEGLEVRLDSRASAGIGTCDGERNSGHGAWRLPRKLKVPLPAHAGIAGCGPGAPGGRR